MTLPEAIVVLILAAVFVWRLYSFYRYRIFELPYKIEEPSSSKPSCPVLVIIPLLREQENAETLVRSLSLAVQEHDKVIFVTTCKEKIDKDGNESQLSKLAATLSKPSGRINSSFLKLFPKSKLELLQKELSGMNANFILQRLQREYHDFPGTAEALQQNIAKLPPCLQQQFLLLEYPHANGMMAHQVNFAFEEATKTKLSFDYICLLTGDSLVNENFLRCFKAECNKWRATMSATPPVIQSMSVFGKNLHLLNRPFPEQAILQAASAFQTGFSVCNELLPMLSTEKKLLRTAKMRAALLSVPSLIGHGCFIERSLFDRQGGFPTNGWCEDIILTFAYASNMVPVLPLKGALEVNEVPHSLRSLLKQVMMWAKTAIQVSIPNRELMKTVRKTGNNFSMFHLSRALIKRWRLNVSWFVLPVASIVLMLYGHYYVFLAILLNLLLVLYAGSRFLKKVVATTLKPLNIVAGGIVFYFVIYPLGFFAALCIIAASPFHHFAKPKTER